MKSMIILSYLIFFAGLGSLLLFAWLLLRGQLFEADPSPHVGQVASATLLLLLILSSVPFSLAAFVLGNRRK